MSGVEWVFESRDLIAQQELSLLQPLQLQLVGLPCVSQGLDRGVEVAVLLAQPLDLGDQRRMVLRREPLVHSAPLYASRPEASTPSVRQASGSCAQMRAFRSGVVLSPKFNPLYLIFSYKCMKRPNHPPKCGGDSQFVTILPLAPPAGYVTISSLKNMRELSHVD